MMGLGYCLLRGGMERMGTGNIWILGTGGMGCGLCIQGIDLPLGRVKECRQIRG